MDIAEQLVAAEVMSMRGQADEALAHLADLRSVTGEHSLERLNVDILEVRLRLVGQQPVPSTTGARLVEEAHRLGDADSLALAWLVAVDIETARGRFRVADNLMRSAESLLPQLGAVARARVHECLATEAWRRGDQPAADYHLSSAVAAFRQAGLKLHAASTTVERARAMATTGRHRQAEALLTEALTRFDASDIEIEAIGALRALAEAAAVDGRPEVASQRAREALDRLGQLNLRRPLLRARLLLLVAQCQLAAGRPQEAERACRRASALLEERRHPELATARAVMALVVAARGRDAEAANRLEAALRQLEIRRQQGDRMVLAATLAHVQARLGRGAEMDDAVALARTLFDRTGRIDADARDALTAAGEVARNAGWLGRAARALTLAQILDEQGGWDDHAVEVARDLRAIADAGAPVPAGPFELHKVIGTGSMGQVWRARRFSDGEPAAVKVVTAEVAADPRRLAMVADEIEAAARLDHPHIVRILGHGLLDSAAESMTGGQMRRDTPWIAMELISGGTLEPLCGTLPWVAVQGILHGLLDALAHAHARGVLHLDVKPANVMVTAGEAPSVKLADFGLAGARTRASSVVGTPTTMAPEQFLGRTDALGPPTDLYALGCLTWEIVTGAPPFAHEDVDALRRAHTTEPIPPLQPRVPVPAELGAWLEVLLRKAPGDRFERAADARWALRTLGPPVELGEAPGPLPQRRWRVSTFTLGLLDAEPLPDAPLLADASEGPPPTPPVPLHWQRAAHDEDARPPSTALFGLRSPRLQGRDRPQALLWAALRDVAQRSRPRLVVVQGLPGTGRHALLHWLRATGHERGSVDVVVLDDDRDPAAVDAELRRRAPRRAQLVLVELDGAVPALLDRIEVWLTTELPVLVAAVGPGPGAPPRVAALLERPEAMLVDLDLLPDEAIRRLCTSQLPLDDATVQAVVTRAAGHPGLAMALLAELGVPGPHGTDAADLPVPVPILESWGDHVQRLLAPLPEGSFDVALLAALLGPVVSVEQWRVACEQLGVETCRATVWERLVDAGLVRTHDRAHWAFVHPALGEVVERLGDRAGRLPVAARAAADSLVRAGDEARRATLLVRARAPEEALEPLADAASVALGRGERDEARTLLTRRSDLLATQGVPEDTAPWLVQSLLEARFELGAGRWDRARAWAQQALDLSWKLGRPAEQGTASLLFGEAAWRSGDPAGARAALQQATSALVDVDPAGVVAAWTLLARLHAAAGDLEQARGAIDAGWEVAAPLAIETPERLELALDRARMTLATGRQPTLPAGLREVCEAVSDTLAVEVGLLLAAIHRHDDDLDAADEALTRAAPRLHQSDRDLVGRLAAATALLELARGAFDDARARLRQAPPPPPGSAAELAWLALSIDDDEADWERRVMRCREAVRHLRPDTDCPWVLALAGRRAAAADRPDRAATAFELAARAYAHLGRDDEAADARRRAETTSRARPREG